MKYAGMPFGMWALFAGSFQKQLIAVLCYDADTAKAIQVLYSDGINPPDGMCGVAWQVIAPMVRQLSLGELVQPSGTWLNDDTIGVFACPDGIRPVIFLLEAE